MLENEDKELAKELLILGWGRLRAKQELATLHKIEDLDMYNRLYKYYKDLISRINSRLEWIEGQLAVYELKDSVNDYLEKP